MLAMRLVFVSLAFLLAASLPAVAHALPALTPPENIIDETFGAGAGSFELGHFVAGGGSATGTHPGGGPGYMGLAPGDTTIIGWTVGGPGDGIDWLSLPLWGAADGIHSVDLTHTTNSSIATTIPTVPGLSYLLSFKAGAAFIVDINQPTNNQLTTAAGSVTVGNLPTQTFVVPFSNVTSNDFSTQTFTSFVFAFAATESATTVTFTATSMIAPSLRAYGPVIDEVSIVVPGPRPFALLVVGVLCLMVRGRIVGGAARYVARSISNR